MHPVFLVTAWFAGCLRLVALWMSCSVIFKPKRRGLALSQALDSWILLTISLLHVVHVCAPLPAPQVVAW